MEAEAEQMLHLTTHIFKENFKDAGCTAQHYVQGTKSLEFAMWTPVLLDQTLRVTTGKGNRSETRAV